MVPLQRVVRPSEPERLRRFVRIFDGCDTNGNFGIFLDGTTNVEVTLTVTDTETNQTRVYTNPLGHPFEAITDTSAFATCP